MPPPQTDTHTNKDPHMARQALPINLDSMQAIINHEETLYNGGLIEFLNHCCKIYNDKFSPPKNLYGQIIYTYIKKNKLKTNFIPIRKTLSEDHKVKIKEGRKRQAESRKEKEKTFHPELDELINKINTKKGKNYILRTWANVGQIEGSYLGPKLPINDLKIFILGLSQID